MAVVKDAEPDTPAKPIPTPQKKTPQKKGIKQRFPILQKKRGIALVTALVILPLLGLLGLLALRNRHDNGGSGIGDNGGDIITDDTFFYGQSPESPSRMYPSPTRKEK